MSKERGIKSMAQKLKSANPVEELGAILAESIEPNKHTEVLLPTLKAINKGSPNKMRARDVRRYCKKLTREVKKADRQPIKSIDNDQPKHISKLLKEPMPANRWLVDLLIPDGCLTIISGESRSFKTWILLHLAKQIAEGELIFNKFITAKNKILLIEEDDKPRTIRDRAIILGCHKDHEIYFWINSGFKVEKRMDRLLSFVKKKKIGVVILDCLLRIYDGDENSSRDIEKLYGQIQRLTNLGITVIITHHHRKPQMGYKDKNPMRGSTDILAGADCQLMVERIGKFRIKITQPKVRVSEEVAPFSVEIKTDIKNYFNFLFTEFEIQNDEETYYKTESAEEHILLLLSESETMDRQEIILKLKQRFDIGQNSVGKSIKNLAIKGQIITETGAKGKMTIRLNKI